VGNERGRDEQQGTDTDDRGGRVVPGAGQREPSPFQAPDQAGTGNPSAPERDGGTRYGRQPIETSGVE